MAERCKNCKEECIDEKCIAKPKADIREEADKEYYHLGDIYSRICRCGCERPIPEREV